MCNDHFMSLRRYNSDTGGLGILPSFQSKIARLPPILISEHRYRDGSW